MKKSTRKSVLIGVGVLAAILILFALGSRGSVPLLSGDSFIAKYKSTPNAVLLDVRTPAEYNAGHIASAINIDFEDSSFEDNIKKLDPSKTYFVYCRSGNRSSKAVLIMRRDNDKNLYELQGGIISAPNLLQA